MTQAHGVEALSKQVITYLSDYCKTELSSIEYYPQLHSFDLRFKVESLVGNAFKDAFCIHVQRPAMNAELYNVISELVNMCDDEIHGTDGPVIYISFANKYKVNKVVHGYITNNNIGTSTGIFKQFPDLTFTINSYTNLKQHASTVVPLGYRSFVGPSDCCDLPNKMIEWLKDYPIFELAIDVDCPKKMSRVAFVAPDGFKDFFQFKYLATLIRLSEPVDFKPETPNKNAIAFDL